MKEHLLKISALWQNMGKCILDQTLEWQLSVTIPCRSQYRTPLMLVTSGDGFFSRDSLGFCSEMHFQMLDVVCAVAEQDFYRVAK